MLILGIETSCDETAAAVVRDGRDVLSNAVYSQVEQHAMHGGVVPEIAARCHVEVLPEIVSQALRDSETAWSEIDAVAITVGPGLASSLLVGLAAAKSLSLALERPLLPINHLEAHLYSLFLAPDAPPPDEVMPMLVLLVTGGNTCLVRVDGVGHYQVLGQTLDDAAGEALDKGSILLGLGYPGRPAMERTAAGGDPSYVRFPRGLEQNRHTFSKGTLRRELCFSFSGVKTALLYHLRKNPDALAQGRLADIAASYQEAILDALILRVRRGLKESGLRTLACVGGVARNRLLRGKIDCLMDEMGARVFYAPPEYCTDNAAMIAGLAGAAGGVHDGSNPMELDVQPNLQIHQA